MVKSNHSTKKSKKKKKKRLSKKNNQLSNNQNINRYTDDYLQSLKLENKALAIPKHIQHSINHQIIEQQNKNIIDLTTNEEQPTIVIIDDNDTSDNENMKARILTAKLHRRTNALKNTIIAEEKYGQHFGKKQNTRQLDELEHDMQEDEQKEMYQSMALPADNFYDRISIANIGNNENNDSSEEINDRNQFEIEQLKNAGIRNYNDVNMFGMKINSQQNGNLNEYRNNSIWNTWRNVNKNENEFRNGNLSIADVCSMIDNSIAKEENKQSLISTKDMSNMTVNELKNAMESLLKEKIVIERRHHILQKKELFFKEMNIACISWMDNAKYSSINEYLKMDEYLQCKYWKKMRNFLCFNEIEKYEQAFLPSKYIKDIQVAQMYEKIKEINEELSNKKKENESKFDINSNTNIFDEKQYLIGKKRRHEQRQPQKVFDQPLKKRRKLDMKEFDLETENNERNPMYNYYINDEIENDFFEKQQKMLNEMKILFEDKSLPNRTQKTNEENNSKWIFNKFFSLISLLNKWKEDFPSEYKSCFVSIAIPKLIAPLIRYELIQWRNVIKYKINDEKFSHPLIAKPILFINHEWYQSLKNFDSKNEIIIPTLIAKLIVPKIMNIIKYEYNCFNFNQTLHLIQQIKCIFDHMHEYPVFNEQIEGLKQCILVKFQETISDFIECQAIETELNTIQKFSFFKQFPCTPMNDHRISSLDGKMYDFVFHRVLNGLRILFHLSLFYKSEDMLLLTDEQLMGMMDNVYSNIMQGFLTFLSRLPIRSMKNMIEEQKRVLKHFFIVMNNLHYIKNKCWIKSKRNVEEDNDSFMVDMDGETNGILRNNFSLETRKHMKRCISELTENLNGHILMQNDMCCMVKTLNTLIT